jgi:hypothetical protein
MANIGRTWRPSRSEGASTQLADRVDELRLALRLQDPDLVAARSDASYLMLGPGRGELHVPLWGDICILCWPELKGCNNQDDRLPDFQLALLLYYLVTADGAPLIEKWVSFAELPDGRMYNQAFQGYTGNEISKAFGLNIQAFTQACKKTGGQCSVIGDASFTFSALPRVPMMVTYWLGDEDFPSSCKILFDESASHYLPIDACAILGSTLTRKILSALT